MLDILIDLLKVFFSANPAHTGWVTAAIGRRGFPNLLIMNGPQGGNEQFNFTRIFEMHAKYIVGTLEMMRARGDRLIDVTKASEDECAKHCAEMDLLSAPLRHC